MFKFTTKQKQKLKGKKRKKERKKEIKMAERLNTFFIGRLVGGLETLNAMERVETDEKDRPKVFCNKFEF